ncbi:MAG: RtcB family protein [Candidatus Pacearchaeota archaeon]
MIINEGKIHIKAWTDDLIQPEYAGALKQAINLSNLPFAFHHIAIMPDTHQGFGMPIGGVLATKDVIIPNAVGVDIGCGMCAVKTSLTEIDIPTLKKIMSEVRKQIPVGFEHQKDLKKNIEIAKNFLDQYYEIE